MVLKKLKIEAEIALRHLEVLQAVMEDQPIGIFKLAEQMDVPRHKVRYSLRVLEHSGIIEPTQYGAVIKENAQKAINALKRDVEEIKKYVEKMDEIVREL